MAGKVFINYRRDDAKGEALALRTALSTILPRAEVTMDVDGGIRPGANFVRALDERVANADIFICIIGAKWSNIADAHGARRLDVEDDFVRIEIASALRRDIPILPVLIDDARMPADTDLPEQIRLLAYKQASRLRHDRFNADADGIAQAITERLGRGAPQTNPRWMMAASAVVALGVGTAAGPTGMRLAGIDSWGPSSGANESVYLNGRVRSLEQQIASLTTQAAAEVAKARADQKRAEDRVGVSGEAQARVKDLEQQAALQGKRIETLTAERAAADRGRQEATAISIARQKEVDGLRAQLGAAQQSLARLREELANAESRLREAGDPKATQALVGNLTRDVEAQRQAATDAQGRVRQIEQQLAGLQKESTTLKQELARAKSGRSLGSLVPGEIISTMGSWVKEYQVGWPNRLPEKFSHLFIVIDGDQDFAPGAIVVGDRWDNDNNPVWKVVHGNFTNQVATYNVGGVTYLGPTWLPEYEALSAEITRLKGGTRFRPYVRYGERPVRPPVVKPAVKRPPSKAGAPPAAKVWGSAAPPSK